MGCFQKEHGTDVSASEQVLIVAEEQMRSPNDVTIHFSSWTPVWNQMQCNGINANEASS
jgi:hypothetical protein